MSWKDILKYLPLLFLPLEGIDLPLFFLPLEGIDL